MNKFGLVVITREGSNPEKFIYESDVLTRFQVSHGPPGLNIYNYWRTLCKSRSTGAEYF